MNSQVKKSHYRFSEYAFEGRFVSYYCQLREVFALAPSSVLEVGVGNRVFGSFLRDNTDIAYTSLDVAEDLQPDVVGSVLRMPFEDKSFDVACSFQVLEHLPYEQFEQALSELCRVSRTHVLISLPHFGTMLSFLMKLPFAPLLRFALKIPFPVRHAFNGQHYWEIGKRGYPVSRIRNALSTHGELVRDFIPFGNEYHHFFVIKL